MRESNERALAMALQHHAANPATPEQVVATAREFEKYLANDTEYRERIDAVLNKVRDIVADYRGAGKTPTEDKVWELSEHFGKIYQFTRGNRPKPGVVNDL